MIRYYLSKLIISFALLLLASCAAITDKTELEETNIEPAGWALEKQKREQITDWEIRGRLGVQTETNGGTMDVFWKQSEQDFSIRFIAPLGAGTYLINGNSEYAEIRFPDGKKETVDNIDEIFKATLDVDLPANAVKDWIRGLPAKSLTIDEIDWNGQGLLNTIKQSGWNVELKKYTGDDVLLPHAIYLSRDDNEELDIRLVLRLWMIDN